MKDRKPQDKFAIRKASDADVALIKELAYKIWPKAYEKILEPEQIEYMLRLFYNADILRLQMAEGQSFLLLYYLDLPIGFGSFSLEIDNAKLNKLYILEVRRGMGAGNYLLKAIENDAFAAGAKQMILNVNRYNTAKDFYKRSGYTIIKSEDISIGQGYFMNDFVMSRSLI